MSSRWRMLQKPPSDDGTLVSLNSHEFIIVPESKSTEKNNNGLHKYNSILNKWTKIMDYPKDLISTSHYAAFDAKTKIIYICNDQSKLLRIDLNSKSIETTSANVYFGRFPGVVFTDDTLHVIARFEHFVFDASNNKFKLLHDSFDEKKLLSPHLAQSKSIITTMYNGNNKTVSVVEYKNNKWIDLDIKNCDDSFASHIIESSAGDYIIFVGGMNITTYAMIPSIFVYDVKYKKLMKSDIPTAETESFTGLVLTRNKDNEDVLTFGFVRDCYKMKQLRNTQSVPFYLIKFIGKWICYEIVHMIGHERHWTIDMDEIVTNCTRK